MNTYNKRRKTTTDVLWNCFFGLILKVTFNFDLGSSKSFQHQGNYSLFIPPVNWHNLFLFFFLSKNRVCLAWKYDYIKLQLLSYCQACLGKRKTLKKSFSLWISWCCFLLRMQVKITSDEEKYSCRSGVAVEGTIQTHRKASASSMRPAMV